MRMFALLTALGTLSVPAGAQFRAPSGGCGTYAPSGITVTGSSLQDGKLRESIRKGRDSGQLPRREARGLKREVRGVEGLEERYSAGGMSDAEVREIEARRWALRDRINARRLGIGKEVAPTGSPAR